MVRHMHALENYTLGTTDGEIGRVSDYFFDDRAWVIRYLVIDTGAWLMRRKALLSTLCIMEADRMHKHLLVCITREQVKNSPEIDTRMPISRQHEIQNANHYGYPYHWSGDGLWGDGLNVPDYMSAGYTGSLSNEAAKEQETREQASTHAVVGNQCDPHLRNYQEVIGYEIHATDGDIGHVKGMLVEEESWAIRYLVVDTSNWWVGNQVLIAPNWLTEISWDALAVSVDLTRKAIQESPRFDAATALNQQHETDLHQHYNRPVYWDLVHRE